MPTRKAAPAAPAEIEHDQLIAIPGNNGAAFPLSATDDDTEEMDMADRLRVALGGAPGDAVRCKLYRRAAYTRKLEWCEDFPPETLLNGGDEVVRREWGPGSYEIRVVGSTGVMARMPLEIAPKPERHSTPAPAPAPAVSDALAEALGRMADAQAAILARLSAAPPPAPPPMTIQDMIGIFAAVKNLTPAPPPAAGIGEIAAQIRAIRELSSDLTPPSADPDSPGAIIGNLASIVQSAIAARQPAEGAPLPTLTVPAGVQTAQPPAEVPAAADNPASAAPSPEEMFLQGLAQGVTERASNNTPPEDCAEWLAETLPDEALPLLGLPNWFDLLAQYMPALTPHRAYLERVKPLLDAALK